MSDRLFDIEGVPEVPLFKEPRRRASAARGVALDARFLNDYPPEWERCPTCQGKGWTWGEVIPFGVVPRGADTGAARVLPRTAFGVAPDDPVMVVWKVSETLTLDVVALFMHVEEVANDPRHSGTPLGWRRQNVVCDDCLGMGRLKGRVRLEAGHRCERCKHPFVTKGDAPFLSRLRGEEVLPTPGHWSRCDEQCVHAGPVRWRVFTPAALGDETKYEPTYVELTGVTQRAVLEQAKYRTWDELIHGGLEAEWRVLTVHHLDGDKANCRWWNLATLCQRCHLEIQAKVVMERVYVHEHSEWFKPHAAGYYAFVYLCRTCGQPQDSREANHRGRPGEPIPLSVGPIDEGGYFPHPFEPGYEATRKYVMKALDELLDLERLT